MSKISSSEIQLSSAFSSNDVSLSLLMGITKGSGRLLSNEVGTGVEVRVGAAGRPDLDLVGGLLSWSFSKWASMQSLRICSSISLTSCGFLSITGDLSGSYFSSSSYRDGGFKVNSAIF